MSMEDVLRRSADEVAGSLDPPGPDLTAIHQGARNSRRQRIAVVAAATATAAVLAAVSIPSGDGRPAPAPPPGEDEVVVVPSRPVWEDDAGIHVGDRTYPTADGSRLRALSLVADGVVYTDDRSRVWFQPRRGEAVEIGRDEGNSLLADADGSTAAWFEPADSGQVLVVYDTTTQATVARSAAPGPRYEPGPGMSEQHVFYKGPIALVDGDRVVYHTASDVRSYDVATDAHEVIWMREQDPSGDFRNAVDFAPGVWTRVEGSLGEDERITFVDDDGTALSITDEVESGGAFTHDGNLFAGVGQGVNGEQVVIIDPASGTSRQLTRDSDLYPIVGWGYGSTLMVVHVDTPGEPRLPGGLLQCDAQTGTCDDVAVGDSPIVPHN